MHVYVHSLHGQNKEFCSVLFCSDINDKDDDDDADLLFESGQSCTMARLQV